MSKHTEGPWKFDTTGQGAILGPPGSDHAVSRPNPPADRVFGIRRLLEIANLVGWEGHHDSEKHGEQRLANGYLIAAAPDLLAAIQAVLSLAEVCPRCNGEGTLGRLSEDDACDRCGGVGEVCEIGPELGTLRAAVARAEGTGR